MSLIQYYQTEYRNRKNIKYHVHALCKVGLTHESQTI